MYTITRQLSGAGKTPKTGGSIKRVKYLKGT